MFGYSYFRQLLRRSEIKVNGKRVKEDLLLQEGDQIVFYVKEEKAFSPLTLYEDDVIVAYHKPKKIKSQGKGSFEELIKRYIHPDYVLCHRLDTNTEGILLFAKNETVFEDVKKEFKNKRIEKKYIAEVYGRIAEPGTYRDYLVKDEGKARVFIHQDRAKKGVEAILEYVPIEKKEESTVVDIRLITGRTHQIRAQMAYHGHQVIGDGKYGKEEINRHFGKKTQQLIAYKLVFHKPEGLLSHLDGKIIEIKNVKI